VDRITRKELKSDKFAQELGLTVNFFEKHRKDALRYGGAALLIVVLALGYMYYSRSRHAARESALFQAMQAQGAPVGAASQAGQLSFPTQQAKDDEVAKRFSDLRSSYSGSDEATVAGYYLAAIKAGQGKLAEAEKGFLEVASSGNGNYASLAKLTLAQIYFSDGRADQGEKTLRELIDNPTVLVTKDQATLALARALAAKKPAEARKLLQPYLGKSGSSAQVAANLNAAIPE
jgi:predicted negative regulator of RcsB-dependent stress response